MSPRLTLSLTLAVLVISTSAHAQWQVDGFPLCTAASNQRDPCGVSDGAGGVIVAWQDTRNGTNDIYARRVTPSGDGLWATDGVALCTAGDSQLWPQIASDGSGGAIIVWSDLRVVPASIYAQRVNGAGDPIWTVDGVAISTFYGLPQIASDNSGGVVVTWEYSGSVYAQRVNAAGVPQWTADGVALTTGLSSADPRIVSDGAGGAIVTWYDLRSGPSDIYAQRVNALGAPQWTANGATLCTAANSQELPAIVSDNAGGAIVTWDDTRSPGDRDVYAQRVSGSGIAQWTADGIPLCTFAGLQASPQIASDGAGGAIVTWYDERNGSAYDFYAQRVNASGVTQWMADGVAVCTADSDQAWPRIVADGAGGAIVTWEDYRGVDADIYAQRVDAYGIPQWTANGVAICTAANYQVLGHVALAAAVPDGAGGVLVAWSDYRGVDSDIYAQRVGSDGKAFSFTVTTTAEDYVTGTLWEAIIQANAVPGAQVIRFDIPGAGPHTIQALCLPFPAITDELTIDGFTQPASLPNSTAVGAPSNAQIKIELSGPSWVFGWSGLVFQAPGTLRGVAISGFNASVEVQSPGVIIEGNYIGTDVTGLLNGPHQARYGVLIQSSQCRVGGSSPAARNVISLNYDDGIRIDGGVASEIYGNYIGVGADATSYSANGYGIHALNGATDSRIGSSVTGTNPNPSEANLIVNNYIGVVVEGSTSIRNAIIGNSLLNNPNGSIDNGADGPLNPNDANDADSGPNEQQNYPELSSAVGNQIVGTMMGAPNQSLYLHFYRSPNCCLNAATLVGATTAILDGSGNAPFTFSITQPIPPGSLINATATDAYGNTSEVSLPVVYYNTPTGPNVPVPLVDAYGSVRGTATYDNVTSPGNTFVTWPYLPNPVLSGGFYAGDPSDPDIYFNVTTSASFTGEVEVCIQYDENSIPGPESALELVHYNGSLWEAVTTSQDVVNNTICGHVSSLSPFVIAVSTATAIENKPLPNEFALHANVPNPFNPQTAIQYDVPSGGADVSITIYDVAGRMVRELVDDHRAAGRWSAQWNGEDSNGQRVASGVYFYRMRAGSFVETKKMVLLK